MAPYLFFLLWTIPLFLLHGPQESLMAFDEVHYAGRAKLMVDSGNWINPWNEPHHKTPGYYWLVALSFQVFGINEAAARLPNLVFGIAATYILFAIAKRLFNPYIGFLAALVLNLQFIWFQYCRLSAPDIPMVTLVLLGILSLLQAERSTHVGRWRLLAGISFGLGFIIRSYVSCLPLVALLPYLVLNHSRHKHLFDWRLYVGYLIGLLPTIIWFWLEWTQFQITSIPTTLGFAADLSGKNRHGGGWYYYLWNLTLNAFPWSLLSVLGGVVVWRRPQFPDKPLCLGYPLVLLLLITFVGTRTPRYSLAMYPFMALGAGVALHWLSLRWRDRQLPGQWVLRAIAAGCGLLGSLLMLLSWVSPRLAEAIPEMTPYLSPLVGFAVFCLGVAWLSVGLLYRFARPRSPGQGWLAVLLIGPWLLFACLSTAGLLGDYNSDLKAAILREDIAAVLETQEVDIVWPRREFDNKRLYRFYTPNYGQPYEQFSQVEQNRFVWVYVNPDNAVLVSQCPRIPAARGWQLVRVENRCNQPQSSTAKT
jgi:4-amino-4-deoxy-L-arabinose transferase-like glycosyltransferase